MKKLLFIAAMLIGLGVQAQTASPALRMANDTIVNATTTYAYLGSVASLGLINGAVEDLSIVFGITKVSGTVAATINLQGSDNGTRWVTVPGTSAIVATDVASQTGTYAIGAILYKYYRLVIVPTGTQRAALAGNFSIRNKQ